MDEAKVKKLEPQMEKTQVRKEILNNIFKFLIEIHIKSENWDFSAGPVVKTLPSNTGGCRFNPWLGS